MTARIAIVGAGIAGLACARALGQAGIAATVFDKGGRPGGRVATRLVDGVAFDFGAQYATARDPGFAAWLHEVATPWAAAADGRDTRWVGTPAMSALPAALANALPGPVLGRRHAAFLHRDPAGWRVRHMPAATMRPGAVAESGGELTGPFDAVLLAMPAPQAAILLRTAPLRSPGHGFAEAATGASYAPCWAAMTAFQRRVEAPDTQRHTDGVLGWTAREGSRPGHAATPDAWVLHAAADWSRAALERDPAAVGTELLAAFGATFGATFGTTFGATAAAPGPLLLAAHRWRYALVETALGQDCLWDADAGIGACGDWCIGGRVEAAWLSGTALARRVLGRP